jgi:hypothetical protein
MSRILPLILVASLPFLPGSAQAQGCSDAGVCTAGPIGELHAPNDTTVAATEHPHFARMTFSYAVGERNTTILQGIAELGLRATERWGFQLRVPYLAVDGDLGSNNGVGDPVITASYAISAKTTKRLDAMLGVKLNAGNANTRTAEGLPLPMPYQTSLGTTDLLMGLNYRNGRWRSALAFQTVLVNENTNTFTHAAWMDDRKAQGYFESAYLERASDAVARIQYAVPVGSLVVQPGLLAIYHVARDKRQEVPMDPAGMPRLPEVVEIVGSEGLTLNLTVDARYTLNDRWAVELAYGSPLIVREERPDGLTRSLVLNMGLRYAF